MLVGAVIGVAWLAAANQGANDGFIEVDPGTSNLVVMPPQGSGVEIHGPVEVRGPMVADGLATPAGLRAEIDAIKANFSAEVAELRAALAAVPPRVLTVEVSGGDIGAIAVREFGRGVCDLTLVLTDPAADYSIGTGDDDEPTLTIPEHCRLEVYASEYEHKSISTGGDGTSEDATRCPTTIRLKHHGLIETGGYAGRSIFVSVLVLEHASLKFRGVTLIEDHAAENGNADPYHEGSIQLRGHSASLSIWDARVEFTQEAFVNSHGSGITFSNIMHVRWVGKMQSGATFSQQYPIMAHRGQSVRGNEAVVSITAGKLYGNNLGWYAEGVDSGYGFTIRYLNK